MKKVLESTKNDMQADYRYSESEQLFDSIDVKKEEDKIREANRKKTGNFIRKIKMALSDPNTSPYLKIPFEMFLNKLEERHETGRGITDYERKQINQFFQPFCSSIYSSAKKMNMILRGMEEDDILSQMTERDKELEKKIKIEIILNDDSNKLLIREIKNSILSPTQKTKLLEKINNKMVVKKSKKNILDFLKRINWDSRSLTKKDRELGLSILLKDI